MKQLCCSSVVALLHAVEQSAAVDGAAAREPEFEFGNLLLERNGQSVGEDKVLAEELAESLDKFSLSLTNKQFQIDLGMSTETFHSMNAASLLKAMHIKRS
jgi:hypothetical protein